MTVPTRGESYAKLLEYLRLAQEQAHTMQLLHQTESKAADIVLAKGWFHVGENLRKMQHLVTELAKGNLQ